MMHQQVDVAPPRDPAPTLVEAAALLTEPRVLIELAYHGHGLRSRDELAAALETAAVRHDRASEGFAERRRYDLATGERERAHHPKLAGGDVGSRCTVFRRSLSTLLLGSAPSEIAHGHGGADVFDCAEDDPVRIAEVDRVKICTRVPVLDVSRRSARHWRVVAERRLLDSTSARHAAPDDAKRVEVIGQQSHQ